MKVAICLPTGDSVKTDFAFSMWNMVKDVRHHTLEILNLRSSHLSMSRDKLAQEGVRREADAVFFVDCDIAFPIDALDRLISHDKPFVGATYISRYPPHGLIGASIDPIEGTGLCRMEYMPVGFSLTKTEVFRTLPRPWYPTGWREAEDEHYAEDWGFCDKMRAAGYELWCDRDLSHMIAHQGAQSFMWGMA